MDRALQLLTVLRGFPVGSGNRVTDGIRLTVDCLTSSGGPQRIVGGAGSNVTDRTACAYLKPRLRDTLIAHKEDAAPRPQTSTNCGPPRLPRTSAGSVDPKSRVQCTRLQTTLLLLWESREALWRHIYVKTY